MLVLVGLGTFMATGLTLVAVWQRYFGRRRVQEILRRRDPAEQRATVVRLPSPAERWELAARQAGLNWTARTYLQTVCGGALVAALAAAAGGTGAALLCLTGAALGPWLVVRHRRRTRGEQLAGQLPAALVLAANTIRSGGTLLQAVRTISRQMPEPIAGEFARVERALHLQVPLGAALDQARQRMGVPEFSAVAVACKVAGQAGADLDVVLENIAREIVEDRQFRAAMRTASSEGRMSAKVVTLIPFITGGLFYVNDPRYFDPLLYSAGGRGLLGGSLLSILLGWVLIRRITDARNW